MEDLQRKKLRDWLQWLWDTCEKESSADREQSESDMEKLRRSIGYIPPKKPE